MGRFRYKAVTPSGEIAENVTVGPSRDAVVARLREGGHFPVEVADLDADGRPADGGRSAAAADAPPRTAGGFGRLGGRVAGRQAVAVFTRELHTLIEAGVALDRALGVIAEATAEGALGRVAADLRAKVRAGRSLADAMADHGDAFGGFYRAMVHAGESGSTLADALGRLAGYLERAGALAATVRSALIYPTLLVAAAFASVVVIVTVVVPEFEILFRQSAAELPPLTRAVLATSEVLRDYGWLLALVAATLAIAAQRRWRRPGARLSRDRFLLRVPLAGPLIAKIEVERFARSLAALLGNGVQLPDALDLAERTVGNAAVAAAAARAREMVKQGQRLADGLRDGGAFPTLAVQMIRIGEESGSLEGILGKLADAYAAEVEVLLKRAVALIEPCLIVGIGVLVAVIVISLLSAIVGSHALAL
jgi:general secretion pathway protein F